MSIPTQINKIIDRRIGRNGFESRGHLQAVVQKRAFFGELLHTLEDYQTLRENILGQIRNHSGEYYILSTENPDMQWRIEQADPAASILQVQKCLAECERLEKRFNRETLNISVVGRARQGKSRLLQAVSGLPNEIIPASDGGDCTGAKSVIANAPGRTRARVTFYNDTEMVSQIQKYIDELRIPRQLGTLAQVSGLQTDLAAFARELPQKTGREQSLFQHLTKYVTHYGDYARLVGTVQDVVKERDIRDYVAQYDSKMRPTYAYLAVKEVQIFTEFPAKEAGNIVLVDTIGLGDTSLGIREKMIRTLREDSDAAILVRLPAANGDSIRVEDDELYDLICDAMGVDALNKWLFFALNVSDKLGNRHSGDAMEEALRQRQLNYAFVRTADCADPQDVEQNLLMPVLQYLSEHLAEVDNSLMNRANGQFADCFQKFFDLCTKVNHALSGGFRKSFQSGGLFDELYEDRLGLPRELKAMMEKYNGKGTTCDVISDNVKTIIRKIATHCPSEEEILHRLTDGGEKGHAPNVYLYFADNLRAAVRDDFEEINRSTIATLQDGFKNEVCQMLQEDYGGRLQRIPLQGVMDNDPVSWLQQLIEEKLSRYPIITEAFADILHFRLNIEGLLEYKIDQALECLDYSPQNEQFVMPDFSSLPIEKTAHIMEQTLQNTIPVVADNLMQGIQELLLIPFHSFRARLRKLNDRIVFKQEGRRELKNFYRENATCLWPEEFRNIAGKELALGQLNECAATLNEKRVKDLFTLKLT